MVNEVNQPQEPTDNEQLGQRLAASNQALADMQAEHRQLLEEMEQLRRRAEDLQRLREQQEREDAERELQYQQTLQENASANITEEAPATEPPTEEEGENPEEAEYIREKLAEIARLKAQFKKVQHMINTTEVIEKHLSKNEETTTKSVDVPKPVSAPPKVSAAEVPAKTVVTAPVVNETNIAALLNTTTPDTIVLPEMPSMADLNAASTQDEKEQLLHTMLSMFEGFSSDLKYQADNLRAERERIRELKESIIRSRQQPPK